MHPEVVDLGGLPHVALLALPRPGVLGGVRAEAPHLAELVGGLLVDEVGDPAVHRVVARREDDDVGRQRRAVLEHHGVLGQVRDLAAHELDVAVRHQVGRADVDVVAGAAPQVLHEQPGPVVAPVQPEPGLLEAVVEVLVLLGHRLVRRDLELVQDPVGQRREDHVGLLGRHPGRDRALGVQVAEADLHQAVALHDVRGRPLHHRHVDVVLPERAADVERRVVAADHHGLLASVRVRPRVRRAVVHVAAEHVRAGDLGHPRLPGHPGREHELLRPQRQRHPLALDLDGPLTRLLRPGGRGRRGARPVRHLHHLHVRLEPVADLVLGREHRPVVGELQVRQVVVPDRVVQAERLVPVAPLVAGPRVLVDDEGRDAELAQPRAEGDAALAAADDQHVRLRRAAEALGLRLPLLLPRPPVLARRRARRPSAGACRAAPRDP